MFPCLEIDLDKVGKNVRRMIQICRSYGIEITGITKVFQADPVLTQVYLDNGITKIGDSRIENLKKIDSLPCEKWLLRMPFIDECDEVVRYSDVSLNSEMKTLQALETCCKRQGRRHKVLLMVDLGDLREGFIRLNELKEAFLFIKQSPWLSFYGIGTNLTCLSFVQPDREKMEELARIAEELKAPLVSAGNSGTLALMLEGGIPDTIHNLRLGESLLFGRERAGYTYLPGTENDAFILKVPVIEAKNKPSMPWGHIGKDSYGHRPTFTDKGERRRVILALGKQDCDIETMWPTDPGIAVIGCSSDHLVLDVTDSKKTYQVGDTISFRLGYFSLLRVMMSPYIRKQYRKL